MWTFFFVRLFSCPCDTCTAKGRSALDSSAPICIFLNTCLNTCQFTGMGWPAMGSSVHRTFHRTFHPASHRPLHRTFPAQTAASLRHQHTTGECCLRFLAFSNRSRAPRSKTMAASLGLVCTMPTAGSTRGEAGQGPDSMKVHEAHGDQINQVQKHTHTHRHFFFGKGGRE